MAITVKHSKVSTIPDGDDSSLVRPSDWNADHTLTGTVPVENGGTGASTANGALTNLLPTQTGNSGKFLSTDGTNTLWSSPSGSGDVVGPASATDNAIARFDTTTGKLIQNSVVTVSDTGAINGVTNETFTPDGAPAYAEGRVFYDSSAHTLNYYNDNSQMSINIGQEQIVRVRNQTGADLTNGTVVYINGATGNTPTVAKALATSFTTADIIGVLTTDIANNGFGYATINGLVNGLDLSAFADGDPVFLSATTAGTFTATEPTRPNYSIQVGVVLRANPSVGTLLVAIQIVSVETQHIIGTVAVDQGGTGQTTYTNGQLLIGNTTGNTLTKSTLTAGTAIGITNGAGSITVTNTAPDQTVAIASGTGISITGTYPNFTVTNTSPSSGGTVTSVTATSPVTSTGGTTPVIAMPAATGSVNGYLTSTDWTTFNNKGSGTVTSITAGTGLSGGTITSSGTIAIDSTVATLSGTQTLTNKTITARVSSTTSISSPLADNSDNFDMYAATAQAGALTISADAGTPTDGRKIQFRLTCDATPRVITFTGGVSKGFKPVGVTMTASGSDFTYTLTASKTTYFGAIYNTSSARWEIVAISQEV